MRSINWLAFAVRGSAAIVALVAGASSFRHIADVAIHYGEHPAVAYALPWSIDGLMVVATAAMLEDRRNNRQPRWSARVAFVFGIVASLGANIASAHPSVGARIVAAVPAVALLLAIEVLTRSGHAASQPADAHSDVAADVPAEQPAMIEPFPPIAEAPVKVTKRRRPVAETRRLAEEILSQKPELTREDIAERLGITSRRLRTVLATSA